MMMTFISRTSSTLSDLLTKVSEDQMARKYLGVEKIPCTMRSPLRRDDHPSFSLYRSGKRIRFKDFSTGETGSLIDLLSLLWEKDLMGVIDFIEKDKDIPKLSTALHGEQCPDAPLSYSVSCKVDVRIRKWMAHDINYWQSYGVPIKWLNFAEVYPISYKFVTVDGTRYMFAAQRFSYAFVERIDGNVFIKIYQPLDTGGFKWSGNFNGSIVSLLSKLPAFGKLVVICSSLKDALCLWANTGIPAVAMQGEGYTLNDGVRDVLTQRFSNVCICFDNDKAGLRLAKRLSERTGLPNIVIPQFPHGKDISDMFLFYGKEQFIQLAKALFAGYL